MTNSAPPREALAVASLTERLATTFRFAIGLEGPQADPQQTVTVETFLRGLATQYPDVYLPGSASYGRGAHYDVTESSADWTLARGAMAKMLAIHLVQCKLGDLLLSLKRAGIVAQDKVETPPSPPKVRAERLLTTHISIQPSFRPAVHTCRYSCRGKNASSGSCTISTTWIRRLE